MGFARIALGDGASILVEAEALPEDDELVSVGRLTDAVRELPQTLQQTLSPVRDAARTMLDQLREVGPDEVEIEFGVDLSAEAGAVIAKTQSAFHLKVRVQWNRENSTERVS